MKGGSLIRLLSPRRADIWFKVALWSQTWPRQGLSEVRFKNVPTRPPIDSRPYLGSPLAAAAAAATAAILPLQDFANDGEAAAAKLDPPVDGNGDHVVNEDGSSGAVPVFGPPRAADGGLGVLGDAASAMHDSGEPSSRPEISHRATAALGTAGGAGIDAGRPAERESQPEEGVDAAEEHQEAQGRSNLGECDSVHGDDQRVIHSQEPNRQLETSSTSLDAEAPRDEPAAVTPVEDGSSSISPHRNREKQPSDVFSVGSMPSSVGDVREDGDTGGGTHATGPVLSGEESTGKRHRGDRSSGRRSHKHKHKRSHRHRDKSSDEGAGKKSRRRRSRDHGFPGSSTSASTITALAPLKRIPPPSLSSAQRAISQGDGPAVEEAPSGGDDGGRGGGGGGGGGG